MTDDGWTVDTLRALLEKQIDGLRELVVQQNVDLRVMLDERYATQTRAVDAAFLAQSTAMATALTAAKDAVDTALRAQEKAVDKAEEAAEKRFESFRRESLAQIKEVSDKTDIEMDRTNERVGKLELRLTSRLDLNTGQDLGSIATRANARLTRGEIATAAMGLIAFVSLVILIISK